MIICIKIQKYLHLNANRQYNNCISTKILQNHQILRRGHMDTYFASVIDNLTRNDLYILGLLSDEGADLKFKSIRKKTIQAKTQLTDATFRKSIDRLEALQFINIVKNSKEHTIFITQYGQEALRYQLEGERV